MRAIVLGSAAGGGFPQWNCGCSGCRAVRGGASGWEARTQDSLAVTGDGARWVLVNASPDVRQQIESTPALAPRGARASPIAAVVLTNGDLDHVLGLFSLREATPLSVYATAPVWRGLGGSVFLRTLERFSGQLAKRELTPGEELELEDTEGAPLGLRVTAFPLPGKIPVHLAGQLEPSRGDNVGLSIRGAASRGAIAYASASARADGLSMLEGHDVVLFDGTFFGDDELVRLGLSRARARDMAHVPIDGPEGSLSMLSGLSGRRLFTHVNNSNPILGPTEERARVEAAGWEIARDGLEITP